MERSGSHKAILCLWLRMSMNTNWRGVARHTWGYTTNSYESAREKVKRLQKESGSWNKTQGRCRRSQCYDSIRGHERKNVYGGLCLGSCTGHAQRKGREGRKHPLEAFEPCRVLGLLCVLPWETVHQHPWRKFLSSSWFSVWPWPEACEPWPRNGFWKYCNKKGIQAVMDTQEIP